MDTASNVEGHATPWNKGKLIGQKLPLKLKEIWAIRIGLQLARKVRELALFNLAIDSKLRGCDLVGLRVHDVVRGSAVPLHLSIPPRIIRNHPAAGTGDITNTTRHVGTNFDRICSNRDTGASNRRPGSSHITHGSHQVCTQLDGVRSNCDTGVGYGQH
jgi:hypothetical protein